MHRDDRDDRWVTLRRRVSIAARRRCRVGSVPERTCLEIARGFRLAAMARSPNASRTPLASPGGGIAIAMKLGPPYNGAHIALPCGLGLLASRFHVADDPFEPVSAARSDGL